MKTKNKFMYFILLLVLILPIFTTNAFADMWQDDEEFYATFKYYVDYGDGDNIYKGSKEKHFYRSIPRTSYDIARMGFDIAPFNTRGFELDHHNSDHDRDDEGYRHYDMKLFIVAEEYEVTIKFDDGSRDWDEDCPYDWKFHLDKATERRTSPEPGYKFVWTSDDAWIHGDYFRMPDNDVTVYCKSEPRTDTAYKVSIYKQNLENNQYTLDYSSTKHGTTDRIIIDELNAHSKYPGFHLSVNSARDRTTIAADGSSSVSLYYDRDLDTPYKVEFYQQDLTGNDYTKICSDTVNGHGKTGMKIVDYLDMSTLKQKYDCLILSESSLNSSMTIEGDGSSVLRLYYDRNPWDVSYKFEGKIPLANPELPSTETYRCGATVNISEQPSLAGYDFSGWSITDVDLSGSTFVMPDNDVAISATWMPHTDTPYSVELYQQNLVDDNYTRIGTSTEHGTTDTKIVDNLDMENLETEYPGFHLISNYARNPTTISGDGTSSIKLYYDRDTPNIRYSYQNTPTNAPDLPTAQTVRYEASVTTAEAPSLVGYNFSGWSSSDMVMSGDSFVMPDHDVAITGTWIPRDDTPYTVEYYYQNLDGTYNLRDTEHCKGTTDTKAIVPTKGYEGFTETDASQDVKANTTIDGDGSTVLKLYFDRNHYQVIYSYENDVPGETTLPVTDSYVYGDQVMLAYDAIAEGYVFSGWSWGESDLNVQNGTFIMPNHPINITASWTAGVNSYRVGYYQETVDGASYMLHEAVNLAADTASSVEADVKNYTGFKQNTMVPDRITNGKVEADGSTVLRLYYDRIPYKITYQIAGVDANDDYLHRTYLYGSSVSLAEEPEEKSGYYFSGWNALMAGLDGTAQDGYSMPAHDVRFIGSWYSTADNHDNSFNITIQGADDTVQVISPKKGEIITLDGLPTKNGRTFLGWSTRSGGKVVYHVGDKLTVSENLVLYAVFSKDVYIQGYADGTFRPDEWLTKREAKLMLSRLNVPSNLSDKGYITTREFYTAASELGVVPLEKKNEHYLTRAEAVTLLNEALEYRAEDVLNPERKFKDVQPDYWAYRAIMIAAN